MRNPRATLSVELGGAAQALCITEDSIVVQSAQHIAVIPDLRNQHHTVVEGEGNGAESLHSRLIEVGRNRGIACYGSTMAVACEDNTVGLWSLSTDSQLHTLSGHTGAVQSVYFLNASTVVSGSADNTIRIWDVQSGQCLGVLSGHTQTVHAFLAHDNLLISGSGDGTAKIWDISTHQCLHTLGGHPSYVITLGFNEDRSLLATGSGGGQIKIWRVADGVNVGICEGHSKVATQLANRGGKLVSSAADGTIRVWNWHDGTPVSVLDAHDGAVRGMVWDDGYNGSLISAGTDGRIKVWKSELGGLEVSEFAEPAGVIWQFGAGYRRIVAVSMIEKGRSCIRVW